MTNLIENAAKYGDENSTITVKTNNCGDYVSIKVINDGIKIKECDYDKIFTKFSRIDNPLTRKFRAAVWGYT